MSIFDASEQVMELRLREPKMDLIISLAADVARAWTDSSSSCLDAKAFYKTFAEALELRQGLRSKAPKGFVDSIWQLSDAALLLLIFDRNSAHRVTQTTLAWFQHKCAVLATGQPLSFELTLADVWWECNRDQHVRIPVGDKFTQADDIAVVTIKPACADGARALIVLTGNQNETSWDFKGYKQLVFITWRKNHLSNPDWMPGSIHLH